MKTLALTMAILLIGSTVRADDAVTWVSGDGLWADPERWTNGLPTDLRTVHLSGKGQIVVPPGRHVAGVIRQAIKPDEDVRLRIRGELIVRRDFVQVGEHKGGTATIELEDRAFHAVSAVYVGGANDGPEHNCVANVTVRGGSFLARVLTLGWGSGSRSTLHVEGSQPVAVHLLDALLIGAEQKHAPSDSTLAFTLDQHGVTPLSIASRSQGLSITRGSAGNRARLKIALAWATDETLSVVGLSDCITVQWCVLAEPLNDRRHAYGSIIGGERTTWHHNLYAHAVSRVPRFAGIAQTDFRNNVLYDWGHTAGYGQFERVNYIANYFKPGPSTSQRPPQFHNGDSVVADRSLHVAGNLLVGHPDVTANNRAGVGYFGVTLANQPLNFPPVVTDHAETAYFKVLEQAGATLPVRDPTDTRILRQSRDGTGKIIDRIP